MRRRSLVLAIALSATACGSGKQAATDASPAADAATCPTKLLTGGTDVAAQGWSVVMQAPAMLSNGPDYVKLQTTTNTNATAQLLLNYPVRWRGKPFKIRRDAGRGGEPAQPLDSAAAILGSFTPFGAGNVATR
jgi:hypothetical protein